MARKKKHERALDARGRLLIERRNLPAGAASSLANDAYHFLRTASWTRITVLFATVYVAINVLFSTILWLGHADVTNVNGFVDYFWFSVQTLATIGYGVLAPNDTLSNVIVTVESFLGFGLTALVTGVFFARFSTPSPRLIFSSVAIIAEHDGQRTLMFRIANARQTAIVDRRFADIIKADPEAGVRYLDFAPFHTTEPLLPP